MGNPRVEDTLDSGGAGQLNYRFYVDFRWVKRGKSEKEFRVPE